MRVIQWITFSIGVWLLLSILTLPFPFAIFPQFNYAQSDSIVLYKIVAVISIPALGIGMLGYWTKKDVGKWKESLNIILTYVLLFFLLKYGFDKIFKNQFYFPEPNILHTPLGQLNKDILFWSTMGTSYGYNIFMGVMEIIPALLLLHRKTRFLGSIFAFGVLLNVFVLNLSFDISVKLLSLLLLLNAAYLLLFYRKLILVICTFDFGVYQINPINDNQSNTVFQRLLKGLIIGVFCAEIFLPFIELEIFNLDHRIKPTYHGSFNITESKGLNFLPENTKRIHFHSDGYLITENENQVFKDFKIDSWNGNPGFILKERNLLIQFSETNSSAQLTWTLDKKDHVIELSRINLDNLPVAQDDLHWTMESY